MAKKRKKGDLPKAGGIPYDVRLVGEKKKLDEIVAGHFGAPASEMTGRKRAKKQNGLTVHLENMDRSHWWMAITFPNGEQIHVNLWTKRPKKGGSAATIHARAEVNS